MARGSSKKKSGGRKFRRTVATARPSTGGRKFGKEEVKKAKEKATIMSKEWISRLIASGVNAKTGTTFGSWATDKTGKRRWSKQRKRPSVPLRRSERIKKMKKATKK